MIINGRGVPPLRAPGVPGDAAPSLGERYEQALGLREGPFLHFYGAAMPFVRDEYRSHLAHALAEYLEQGFLEGDDSEGPVQRQQASADHADGVVQGAVNLVLRDGVLVGVRLARQPGRGRLLLCACANGLGAGLLLHLHRVGHGLGRPL